MKLDRLSSIWTTINQILFIIWSSFFLAGLFFGGINNSPTRTEIIELRNSLTISKNLYASDSTATQASSFWGIVIFIPFLGIWGLIVFSLYHVRYTPNKILARRFGRTYEIPLYKITEVGFPQFLGVTASKQTAYIRYQNEAGLEIKVEFMVSMGLNGTYPDWLDELHLQAVEAHKIHYSTDGKT